jgi:hypothetical protein
MSSIRHLFKDSYSVSDAVALFTEAIAFIDCKDEQAVTQIKKAIYFMQESMEKTFLYANAFSLDEKTNIPLYTIGEVCSHYSFGMFLAKANENLAAYILMQWVINISVSPDPAGQRISDIVLRKRFVGN